MVLLIKMNWTINQWQFDSSKQTIKTANQLVRLEPMQSELLLYFCQNTHDIIHRDKLIEQVWCNQFITENAVNKVIAKLRKSLADDVKKPRFIVTYPKKGYKFIAIVKQSEKGNAILKSKRFKIGFGSIVLFIIVIIAIVNFSAEENYFSKATALTRGGGEEYEPNISPDGKYLSYSALENYTYHLYIKNLQSGQTAKVSDGIGNAGGSHWSQDGTQLIYLYTNEQQCEFRLMEIVDGRVTHEKNIHNCPANSYGSAIFTHTKNQIIYAERLSVDQPYYIYSMDLTDSSKVKLRQPEAIKAGNSEFNLHPFENKLLISSPDQQQWLTFYELDLDTNELKFLFNKNQYLCCAIWNHQGNKIITMGHHPAYSLIEMSLDGKEVNTIYEATHQVGKPIRAGFNKTYIYSGGNYDYNIDYIDIETNLESPFIDSSVVDELPNLSNDGQFLGFLSRKSGTSQIWIKNIKSGLTNQLTKFNEHGKHYDLKWSPDDKRLALLISNGIKIINTASGESELLKLPHQEIKGMSWFDVNHIAYSLKKDSKWQVYHYDINDSKIQSIDSKWAYIYYDNDEKHHAYINHQQQLFIGGKAINQLNNPRWLFQNRFDFQYEDEKLYYYDHNGSGSFGLYSINLLTMNSERLFDSICSGFSILNNDIYYCNLKNKSADIFQISR
jgi:transcriptional activator of cad operon